MDVDERLFFDGDVTTEDLQVALTPRKSRILAGVCIVLLLLCVGLNGLLLLGMFVRYSQTGTFDQRLITPIALFVGLTILLASFFWRTMTFGKRMARILPGFLGPRRGWISVKTLHYEREHNIIDWNLDALQHVRIQNDYLLLSFQLTSIFSTVIPLRSFARPDAARALAKELKRQCDARPKMLLDPRAMEDVQLPTSEVIPEDAIRLRGLLMTDDVDQSPVRKQLKKVKWILGGTCFGAVGLLGWMSWGLSAFRVPLLVFIPVVVWVLWNAYRRSVMPITIKGKPIWFANGYLSSSGMRIATFRETSTVTWEHFVSVSVSDTVIALEHPGTAGIFSMLAKRQFGSDEDWNNAVELARQKVGK